MNPNAEKFGGRSSNKMSRRKTWLGGMAKSLASPDLIRETTFADGVATRANAWRERREVSPETRSRMWVEPTACIRCHPAENSSRARWCGGTLVRYGEMLERPRGSSRGCIFIPDGADAADESGYVGSLLPSFVSPPPPSLLPLPHRRSIQEDVP